MLQLINNAHDPGNWNEYYRTHDEEGKEDEHKDAVLGFHDEVIDLDKSWMSFSEHNCKWNHWDLNAIDGWNSCKE
jgi:hypothetical protein